MTARLILRRTAADGGMAALVVLLVVAGTALTGGLQRSVDDVRARALVAAVAAVPPTARDLVATLARPVEAGPAEDPAARYAALVRAADELATRRLGPVAGPASWTVTTSRSDPLALRERPARVSAGSGVVLQVGSGWRDRVRVVEGRLPAGARPGVPAAAVRGTAEPRVPARVEVVLAAEAALALHLRVGDVVEVVGAGVTSRVPPMQLMLVGTFAARDPRDPFWTPRPALLHGDRSVDVQGNMRERGTVIADAEALPVLATELASAPTLLEVRVPVLADRTAAGGDPAELVGRLLAVQREPVGPLRFESALDEALADYLDQRRPVDALVLVLLGGLVAVALLVLALALVLLVQRRDAGLAVLLARGTSAARAARQLAAEGLLIGIPCAVAGSLLGALVPGRAGTGVVAAGVLAAVAPAVVLPLAAVPVLRTGRPARRRPAGRCGPLADVARDLARRSRAIAAEVLVTAGAAGSLLVLRSRGVTSGPPPSSSPTSEIAAVGPPDPLVVLGPTLAAVAVALLTARVLGPILAAASRWAARRPAAVGFLGLARASRERPAGVLGLAAIVVALATAGQAAVAVATVRAGTEEAARLAVGADVRVRGAGFDPGQVAAVSRLPAVRGTAPVSSVPGATLASGRTGAGGAGGRARREVTLLATDPGALAAVQRGLGPVALPPALAALLAPAPAAGGTPRAVPVVTSPGLVDVGPDPELVLGGRRVPVRVVAVRPRLLGAPPDREWVLAPVAALRSETGLLLLPQDLLLALRPGSASSGPVAPSGPVVGAAVADVVTVQTVAGRVAATGASPLVAAVRSGLPAALAIGALYAGAAVWLTVAVGARSRTRFLAHLRALGLSTGQVGRLIALEVAPPVLAASLAGPACGALLGLTVLRAADVRALTGALLPTAVVVPAGLLGLATVTVLAATVLAAAVAVVSGRRVSPAAAARTGEV